MKYLKDFGYNDFFQKAFHDLGRDDLTPARITGEEKNSWRVITEAGELRAEATGKLLFETEGSSSLPKTGDWVAVSQFDDLAIIHDILPRQNMLSRRASGRAVEEQVIASNLDVVFVVQGLDNNFNVNRLERQAAAIRSCGISSAVILTKTDLAEDLNPYIRQVKNSAAGGPVFCLSNFNGEGFEPLLEFLQPGKTYALIGSSGAGKSSLLNFLSGKEVMKTSDVRASDSRGRHTTTSRKLFRLDSGILVLDTPGMREFGLWTDSDTFEDSFGQFSGISANCLFTDCTHVHEKGCAVIQAVQDGTIEYSTYENYLKMRKEVQYLESKTDSREASNSKKKWKIISKEIKRVYKNRDKR